MAIGIRQRIAIIFFSSVVTSYCWGSVFFATFFHKFYCFTFFYFSWFFLHLCITNLVPHRLKRTMAMRNRFMDLHEKWLKHVHADSLPSPTRCCCHWSSTRVIAHTLIYVHRSSFHIIGIQLILNEQREWNRTSNRITTIDCKRQNNKTRGSTKVLLLRNI